MNWSRLHALTAVLAPLLALFGVTADAALRSAHFPTFSETTTEGRASAPSAENSVDAPTELPPTTPSNAFGGDLGPALDTPAPIGFVSTRPPTPVAPSGLTTLRTDRHPPRNLPLLV